MNPEENHQRVLRLCRELSEALDTYCDGQFLVEVRPSSLGPHAILFGDIDALEEARRAQQAMLRDISDGKLRRPLDRVA